jgi:tRNA-dihydrouridine synthase B
METFSIAGMELRNRYVLGPMAGFSDYSLRKITADYGASLVYTEMESAEALVYQSAATLEDLKMTFLDKKTEPQTKLALQIFAGKKDILLQAIPLCEANADYDFLDFNAGCPVPKVVRQNAGSAWLKRPEELIDVLQAMVQVSRKPVILKIRIGFDAPMDIVSLARKAEAVGVSAIAIHGRTRNEGFAGPVHYEMIHAVKAAVAIPIIANGGIDADNAQTVLGETQADALMIAQKAIGYPRIFEDLVDAEEGRPILKATLTSQLSDLQKQLELIFATKEERQAADIMRGVSVRYLKGFENASIYRNKLIKCRTLKDYMTLLDNMRNKQ